MKKWIRSLKGWLKRKRRLLTLAILLLMINAVSVAHADANTTYSKEATQRHHSYNITLVTELRCGENKEFYSFETIADTNRWLDAYADDWDVISHIEGNYVLHKKGVLGDNPCTQSSLYRLLPDSLLSLFGDTFGPTHLIQSFFHLDTMMLESSKQQSLALANK